LWRRYRGGIQYIDEGDARVESGNAFALRSWSGRGSYILKELSAMGEKF